MTAVLQSGAQTSTRRSRSRLWQAVFRDWPLHWRISAVVLVLLLGLGATLTVLSHHFATTGALEASQRLQLDLARNIVAHSQQPLISASGQPDAKAMQSLAMHAMAVNPALEVYLLDTEGRILGHALDNPGPLAERVDMEPVRPLAARLRSPPTLPLLGDDPRRPGQRNVVSVEGLSADGQMTGYLYVVLQGQTQQALLDNLAASRAWREAGWLGLAALLSTAALAAWLVLGLTRPLRRLRLQVEAFRADDGVRSTAPAGDEVTALRAATLALQRRITEQITQLEAQHEQRRELVSNISHDLHTPLAAIEGYTETLLMEGHSLTAEARTQALRTVLRNTQRLRQRVAELFELSQLDGGQRQPHIEPFCLAELLHDVAQDHQWQAQQRGVKLEVLMREAQPGDATLKRAQALGDIGLIERVLQNLIDNALRHTPSGGSVALVLKAQGRDRLRVSVVDTGQGIAADHLPHVFERYWRASETPPQEGGTVSAGLGLAIVKRILDLHHTPVQVKSKLARGTSFAFSLPQASC